MFSSPAPPRRNTGRALVLLVLCLPVVLLACSNHRPISTQPASAAAVDSQPAGWDPLLDELQERTFRFFWEQADPQTGLVPDRWPTPSFSSIAAVGFALASYPVAVEQGWISRAEARQRVQLTLRFFQNAATGPAAHGVAGNKGFFYHFLDMERGTRFAQVELSTVDTALLMAGVLVCQSYFDGGGSTQPGSDDGSDDGSDNTGEAEIRALADQLYRAVQWDWASPRAPLISMGWYPESGFHSHDWRGYNEAMIVYLLALGSPTHPVTSAAWQAYTSTARWGSYYGWQQLGFAPLFGHQYSHIFVDFRGIQDALCRTHGIDYFETSRRATLAQQAYAVDNPGGFLGYGEKMWGLTPCDGPADLTTTVNDREVRFFTYAARGASFTEVRDDGTIAPWAAAASLPFAPEIVIPTLHELRRRYGAHLWTDYGFLDAVNPTFNTTGLEPQMGHVVPGVAWFADDVLGIDQGPIVLMIENYRSGLIWRLLRKNPYVVTGLRRAGFCGGWLDQAP